MSKELYFGTNSPSPENEAAVGAHVLSIYEPLSAFATNHPTEILFTEAIHPTLGNMATDWGSKGLDSFTQTTYSEPYEAINPATLKVSRSFIACIVGASRGIGAGIALAYARAGATGLVLASRRVSGLEQTAQECKAVNSGVEIEIVECEITSCHSVRELACRTKAKFGGRLDVVAVNSGFSGPVVLKVTDTDPMTFQNAINVNYVGTFLCAKYMIPLLLDTADGARAFIAVSSQAALIVRGPIANAQYCVSKMAQLKLMEHIHEEYHRDGLSAYSVHPGAVMSEMAEETAPEEFKPFLTDSPELCGAFCVWLTQHRKDKRMTWLSGRLLSAKWDVNELQRRKDEILGKDLLKTRALV